MIVVTGATGFIGKRVMSELVKDHKPADILCLVWSKDNNREREAKRWLKSLGVQLKEVDLLDKKTLQGLPTAPALIIHLAATTDTALVDHSCNDMGTSNLLQALKPAKKTNFIFTGTGAMYCGRSDCRKPLTEISKPMPSNRYGRSKLRAEIILRQEAKKRGCRLTILRPPTVYGASPRDDSLFDFLKKLIYKGSLLARLNWPGLTSLVWVDDMAKAIIWATYHPAQSDRANVFLVSAESLTLAEISRLLHKKLEIEYREITLPRWFWQLSAQLRKLIPWGERILPAMIYNLIWRASLVVDDVLYCDAQKIKAAYKSWRPSLFKDKVDEVI